MPSAKLLIVEFDPDHHIWECAATEDSRPVLTGVYVDPKGWLVAADGFTLAVVPARLTNKPKDFAGCIVPTAALRLAFVPRGEKKATVTIDLAAQAVHVPAKVGSVTMTLIAGQYPQWRRLLPERRSLGPVPVTMYSLPLLTKAWKAVGQPSIPVLFSARPVTKDNIPASSGVLLGTDGAFALIMPLFGKYAESEVALKVALRNRVAPPPAPKPLADQPAPKEIAEREEAGQA